MNTTAKCLTPLIKSTAWRSYVPMLSRNLSSGCDDVMTHTGQQWDRNDYRLVRYMNAPKQVNPNWAVNLIAGIPVQEVTERVVWCDGGSGPEGHPRIYINLDKPGNHCCGYCGLRFVKKGGHH